MRNCNVCGKPGHYWEYGLAKRGVVWYCSECMENHMRRTHQTDESSTLRKLRHSAGGGIIVNRGDKGSA